MRASILVSFRDNYYFGIVFNCYSDRFEEDKLYQVDCNATNEELRLKIPQEGTKKCIQVSQTSENVENCFLYIFFSFKIFSDSKITFTVRSFACTSSFV